MTSPGNARRVASAEPFVLGEWTVLPALDRLQRQGESRRLEPKVMEVLLELAARPGEVLSKESLLAAVWTDTFVADGVLLRSISELRRAFDDDFKAPRYIETIPKRGYRLIAAVAPVAVTDDASLAENPVSADEAVGTRPATPDTDPTEAGASDVGRTRAATVWRWVGAMAVIVSSVSLVALWYATLRPAPAPEEVTLAPGASSPAAETYARGREFFERGDAAANANAIELFKRALEKDSEFAAAYAGLAIAYADGVMRFDLEPFWLAPALDAGSKAVTLDPSLAQAHLALGHAHLAAGRWNSGREALGRALELDPKLTAAHHDLGRLYAENGQLDEAVRNLQRAMDPPETARLHADLARVYRLLEERSQAETAVSRSLDLEPFEPLARLEQARLAAEDGALVTARDLLRAFLEVAPAHTAALDLAAVVERASGDQATSDALLRRAVDTAREPGLAHLHLAAVLLDGEDASGEAQDLLNGLEECARQALTGGSERWQPHYLLAGVASLRDHPDVALRFFEAAEEAGFRDLGQLAIDPAFERLRGDAEFRRWRAGLGERLAETRRRTAL